MVAGQVNDERTVRRLEAELESLRKREQALRAELVELQGRAKQLETALLHERVAGMSRRHVNFWFLCFSPYRVGSLDQRANENIHRVGIDLCRAC